MKAKEEETPPQVCASDSSSSSLEDIPPLVDKQSGGTASTADSEPATEDDTPLNTPSFESVSTVLPSSPPRSPLHSPVSPKSSPLPVSPSSSSKPPVRLQNNFKTTQMMVLGKDGSDYRDLMASRTKQSERQQALLDEEKKMESFEKETLREEGSASSLWHRLWHGKGKHNSLPAEDYTSMDHAEQKQQQRQQGVARRPQQRQRQNNSDLETPVYQGLNEDPLHSPPPARMNAKMHRSLLRNLPLPSTKEEQIQQDCSFLYRPVDDNNGLASPRRNRRTLRAILDPPPAGVSTLYQDAQEIWAPPVVAQYKAKYQQLNQEYDIPDDHDRFADYNDYAVTPPHELTLEEQQQQSAHEALIASVNKSSLFYEHQESGRVSLRLPRDRVRLMVASAADLEPGILSVIQCRKEDEPTAQNLEYCLTVSSNLYQRVVSEMTQYAHTEHGLDSSFYASDHADIRWAIGIMIVIMIILGINTLVFGLD